MARYGMREVADVTFYDLSSGTPVLFLDTLKMSDLTIAAKSVDAIGGKGANRLLSFDYGRTVTFDVQDALLNPTALASLTGNALTTGVQTVYAREVLTTVAAVSPATGVTVTLPNGDHAVSGSVQVFSTTDGYDQTLVPSADVTVTAGTGANGDTINISSAATVTAGSKVIVYYQKQTGATALMTEITADTFPSYYKVIGDTFVRNDSTGADEPYQIIISKAKLMPGFKLTLQAEGNAPTVFDFKLEAYKPSDSELMVQMIKY